MLLCCSFSAAAAAILLVMGLLCCSAAAALPGEPRDAASAAVCGLNRALPGIRYLSHTVLGWNPNLPPPRVVACLSIAC